MREIETKLNSLIPEGKVCIFEEKEIRFGVELNDLLEDQSLYVKYVSPGHIHLDSEHDNSDYSIPFSLFSDKFLWGIYEKILKTM